MMTHYEQRSLTHFQSYFFTDLPLSRIVRELPQSGIRRFFDIAAQMQDVISLSIGEPDFLTPWAIREAAIYSLERGQTTYTSNLGILELRELIARQLQTCCTACATILKTKCWSRSASPKAWTLRCGRFWTPATKCWCRSRATSPTSPASASPAAFPSAF